MNCVRSCYDRICKTAAWAYHYGSLPYAAYKTCQRVREGRSYQELMQIAREEFFPPRIAKVLDTTAPQREEAQRTDAFTRKTLSNESMDSDYGEFRSTPSPRTPCSAEHLSADQIAIFSDQFERMHHMFTPAYSAYSKSKQD